MKSHDNQDLRNQIDGVRLIDVLQSHIWGDVELTTSQVAAAKMLLGKILPDMRTVDSKNVTSFSHEQALKELS